MAVDTVLFFQNLLDYRNVGVLMSASNTAIGFASRYARDPNFATAWKPPDSETTDEYLQVDGATVGWLGAATDTAYCAIAYDARGADQTVIVLNVDASDNPAGTFATNIANFTLDKTAVGVQFVSFAISSTAKRYYRLTQPSASGRGSGTGKTRTAKVHAWAMFDKDTVFTISTTAASAFPKDAVAAHRFQIVDRTATEETGVGARMANQFGASGHTFDIPFDHATPELYAEVRDELMKQGGARRANFIQHEGIRNPSQASFFLCRLASDRWGGEKPFIDQFSISIPFSTEGWN
jgi:hypothetical protein